MGKSFTKNPTVQHPASNPGVASPSAVRPRDEIDDWDAPNIPDESYPAGTGCTGCTTLTGRMTTGCASTSCGCGKRPMSTRP